MMIGDQPTNQLPASDFRLPTSEFRLASSDCRVPASEFRLPSSDSRVPTPEFRVPILDSRVPTPESRLPSSDSRVPTPEFRVPSSADVGAHIAPPRAARVRILCGSRPPPEFESYTPEAVRQRGHRPCRSLPTSHGDRHHQSERG
jgi:hypothetical protein